MWRTATKVTAQSSIVEYAIVDFMTNILQLNPLSKEVGKAVTYVNASRLPISDNDRNEVGVEKN